MCGKGYLLCEQHNYRDSNSRTYRVMCCYRVVCSSQINICCTAGAAGDSLADHTNSTSANPFTSLFPIPPSLSHGHPFAPSPPFPPFFGPHSPQNYHSMAPYNSGRPKRTARPRSPPSPPSLNTRTQLSTQHPRGVLSPLLGRSCGRLRAKGACTSVPRVPSTSTWRNWWSNHHKRAPTSSFTTT